MNTFRKIRFVKNYGDYFEKGTELEMHIDLATRLVRYGYAVYSH